MRLLSATALLLLAPALSAQEDPVSARHRAYARYPAANAELPAHVQAPEGKITLYADHAHADAEGVPLYLVNRSSEKLMLRTQDGDTYIKLEYQTPSGEWKRAQAHRFSDCGNSYGGRFLQPGLHYRMLGYRPEGGKAARVRYRGWSDLAMESNEGEGFYLPQDVLDAEEDGLSVRHLPGRLTSMFDPDYSGEAYQPSERLAALRMLAMLGEQPRIRKGAEKWKQTLDAVDQPTPEQREALPVLAEVLKSSWGKPVGTEVMLRRCLDILKQPAAPNAAFGSLEGQRQLLWWVLVDRAKREMTEERRYFRAAPMPVSFWKEATTLAYNTLFVAESKEHFEVRSLLGVTALTDSHLTDAQMEQLLAVKDGYSASLGASALARRGKMERLVELGFMLPKEQRLAVFGALARGPFHEQGMGMDGVGGPRQPDFSPRERDFWASVIQADPVKTSARLYHLVMGLNLTYNPFTSALFDPVYQYWNQEASRPEASRTEFDLGKDEFDHLDSVRFVIRRQGNKDNDLLRKLLSYGGYSRSEGARSVEGSSEMQPGVFKHFRIRRAAADELKRRGQPVPPDVVFELFLPKQ